MNILYLLISSRERFAAYLTVLVILTGCANPMTPTGGPPDETPPQIVESAPAAEAVRVSVDTDRIRLVFADYVDERSLEQAVSISPPLDGRPQFNWSGRRVDIELPHSLEENATYILTLDTDLQTWRSVNLPEPISIAFSTGDVIDQAELSGRVIRGEGGRPAEGYDVFAYPAPDSLTPALLPERPVYRTQTSSDGTFHLEYLREQPYYVIAVQDRNRNRQPDPTEPFAAPPQPLVYADTSETETHTWIATVQDTIPPELLRTQPRSAERVVLRFNEPIQLQNQYLDGWTLVDSLRNQERAVLDYFLLPDDPTGLTVRTEPLQPDPHRVDVPDDVIADSTGTPMPAFSAHFTPPAERDTVQTRFEGFLPSRTENDPDTLTLYDGQRPGFVLNEPADTTELRSLLSVVDSLDQSRAYTLDGQRAPRYRIDISPPLDPGETIRVQFNAQPLGGPADTLLTRAYHRLPMRDVGEIAGTVDMPDLDGPVVIELRPAEATASIGRRTTTVNENSSFRFERLPEGTYHLRAFVDLDGTGTWDPGAVIPYHAPTPITWSEEPIRVRARWETTLSEPIQLDPETRISP